MPRRSVLLSPMAVMGAPDWCDRIPLGVYLPVESTGCAEAGIRRFVRDREDSQ